MSATESRRTYFSADHRRLTPAGALTYLATGAALAGAALVGITLTAGVSAVVRHLLHAEWAWLAVALAAVAASHLGYVLGYREVIEAEDGPKLGARRIASLVVTGFGAFIPRGGFALDAVEWREHGLSEREARRRVLTLAVLEYAVLAPATFAAAAVLLFDHVPTTGGLVASWLIGVPAGTVITLWLFARRRGIPEKGRLRSRLVHFLDGIRRMFAMLRCRRTGPTALAGMTLYWVGDIGALAACFAAVDGSPPSVAILVVGYATGYALTRRSLPLAGAGAVEALLPFALSWVSLPLASAVAAVFAYRLINLWLPVVPAAVGMRHLQRTRTRTGS